MLAARFLILMPIALAGCASTRIDAQWFDPQLPAQSLRGARVMVACEAYDPTLRQLCQDEFAAELTARGANPVIAPATATDEAGRRAAAQVAGAKAVWSTTVSLDDTRASPGWSLGLGGFGIGSGRVQGGVGVSVPIGGGQLTRGYAASGTLTDAASGRLMWSARATAPPSSDLQAQMSALARVVVGAADKAGLF